MGNKVAHQAGKGPKTQLDPEASRTSIDGNPLTEESWLEDALVVSTLQGEPEVIQSQVQLPILTADLITVICLLLDVQDIFSFTSSCVSFHNFQTSTDHVLWYNLLKRDYQFILESEVKRKAIYKKRFEGNSAKWDIKMRSESLVETCGSYQNAYKEVFFGLKLNPQFAFVHPLSATLANHTKLVHYQFAAFDMIRGINSWGGPIHADSGDTIQFNCFFTDYGCNKPVHVHTQMVQWNFLFEGVFRPFGLEFEGSPSSLTSGDLKWSYWQSWAAQEEGQRVFLPKINNAKNNALLWKHGRSKNQWFKVRYYVSVDKKFKNPGPYPEVEVEDSNKTAVPAYEFLFLLKS
eukprot:TRINITY_DN3670_c0_g1_i1.p1 TRINITY_DN3670_c0_g1~~TRINITY_DN3670_c0_g1_i1.p1  ORF type:complete len:348 (-),score=40.24 TRINITY_DN3670_c0_g1_i1:40-1083(-)